jgi:hypothetical protein
MTAEILFKFTSNENSMKTERYVLVEGADLAERMVVTQAINAVVAVMSMLHGNDSILYKFNPDEVKEVKEMMEGKIAKVQDTNKTLQDMSKYASDAIVIAQERNTLLRIATDKLNYIASGKLSKSGAVSTAKSGLDDIKAKMEESAAIPEKEDNAEIPKHS